MIFVPATLVAAGYLAVSARVGVPLNWRRFLTAGSSFLVAIGIVYLYRRRKARSRGS